MTLLAVTLLWWFLRFDMGSGHDVPDGGVTDPVFCESLAAGHGALALLVSQRPEIVDGRVIGHWQRACFQAPLESMVPRAR